MTISIISALGKNRVIGKNNQLPWHMPADLQHFKKTTLGKPVLMGKRTFESIGKPLPNRTNIILSDDVDYKVDNCIMTNSIDETLKVAENFEEIFIIGGASVYKAFISKANKLYLTFIDGDFDGDTFFPEYNPNEWKEITREQHQPDEKNLYPYTFVVLEKI